MDYENRLDFRICFENVDQALEVALATNRKNVIIFMCINNISRSHLADALGYQRPAISKNLISNPNSERKCNISDVTFLFTPHVASSGS